MLPNRRDPRLRVAAVIVSLQVLGQVALNFKVSVAQILVTVGACAVLEIGVTFRRQRALVWPASALLTGNGVSFILRVSGTEHGDLWTIHGIHFFLIAAGVALLSKYVLVREGQHYFNPSNLGLVVVLLLWGPYVFPQYFWWGPLDPAVIAALVVIVAGVVVVLRPLKMLAMAAAFLVPFYLGMALLALRGHCFTAIWHTGPICGASYWSSICLSPELLIFVFYMMSDPRTAPRVGRARMIYGAATALVAGILIAPQQTEYGTKVALLVGLTVVCSVVPLIERLCARGARDRRRLIPTALTPIGVAVLLIALTSPLGVWALRHDANLLSIERGISRTDLPAQ